MNLGDQMKNRMDLLGLSVPMLAEQTFLSEEILWNLLENRISVTDLDDFDQEILKNALHWSDLTGKADSFDRMVVSFDSAGSKSAKIQICDFLQDFAFLSLVESDENLHPEMKGVYAYRN